MDSRELYPTDEQRRRIMDFIMAAGETLLENGAEVFRVEQTMEIMARSFHLREFHVYVLTNGIFASAGTAEIAEVRNVPVRTTHLGRVVAVNALSRQIAAGGVTLDEAECRLAEARRIPFPKGRTQLLAGMSGAACFALIFGGTVRSALSVAGFAVELVLDWVGKIRADGEITADAEEYPLPPVGGFGALGLDFDDDYEVVEVEGVEEIEEVEEEEDNDGTTEAAEHRPKDRAKLSVSQKAPAPKQDAPKSGSRGPRKSSGKGGGPAYGKKNTKKKGNGRGGHR